MILTHGMLVAKMQDREPRWFYVNETKPLTAVLIPITIGTGVMSLGEPVEYDKVLHGMELIEYIGTLDRLMRWFEDRQYRVCTMVTPTAAKLSDVWAKTTTQDWRSKTFKQK
jgi:hypothetical protein